MSEVPLYPTCTLLVTTMDKVSFKTQYAVLQDTISIAVADFGFFAEGKLFGGHV